MSEIDSTVDWLRKLEQGDSQAATALWDRYFARLVLLANRRLGNAPRREFDEEDIALSVMHNLARSASEQRLSEIVRREQLWGFLVTCTAQKVVDRIRASSAQKRGGGKVRGESVFLNRNQPDAGMGINDVLGDRPTPEIMLDMEERLDRLLAELPDDRFRQIAVRRMEGYSNQEIADQLGVSARTIERKLGIIRDIWSDSAQLRDATSD